MSHKSEEQPEILGYCIDCGGAVYDKGSPRGFASYCPYSEGTHTLENTVTLVDDNNESTPINLQDMVKQIMGLK